MSHEGETVFNKNTYGNVKENKQNVKNNKEEYILRLHSVNITLPLNGHQWHYNVTRVTL